MQSTARCHCRQRRHSTQLPLMLATPRWRGLTAPVRAKLVSEAEGPTHVGWKFTPGKALRGQILRGTPDEAVRCHAVRSSY